MEKLGFISLSVILFLLACGVSDVGTDKVPLRKGDAVTLHTDVETKHQEDINWYYNNIRIAEITKNQIRTNVHYENGNERYGDRLKVDHQTGSLTITNIRTTDSGDYQLMINSSSKKIFNISVDDVPDAKPKEEKKKEGDSVTLDPGVIRKPDDVMTWYFYDIVMAKINGDHSLSSKGDPCDERFSDRLKVDHQTGSLTITNTRAEDSGLYKVEIINSSSVASVSNISVQTFCVNVSAVSGLAGECWRIGGVVGVGIGGLVLGTFLGAVIYKFMRSRRNAQNNRANGPPAQNEIPLMDGGLSPAPDNGSQ